MALVARNWVVWLTLLFWLVSCQSNPLKDLNNTSFDYVVLGGGTAGLVVASRLSEDPHITVAVIEAGDFERSNPNVTNITTLGLPINTRVDWQYVSAPQVFGGNRSIIWSAGKGLGGSSLINGESFLQRTGRVECSLASQA